MDKHLVKVITKEMNYEFTISRKITILTGDSGIGKTRLVVYLEQEARIPSIQVLCKLPCIAITEQVLDNALRLLRDRPVSIFFFDEHVPYIETREFIAFMCETESYFVFINREVMRSIPYGMYDIYTLRQSGKFNYFVPMYVESTEVFVPEVIVTEDSRAGNTFFRSFGIPCYTTSGNANIVAALRKWGFYRKRVLIVLDACTYGPHIKSLREYIDKDTLNTYSILSPESFEYLILSSKMFDGHVSLELPGSYWSLERYYNELLHTITQDTPAHYVKDRLNYCYTKNCCFRHDACVFSIYADKRSVILGKYGKHLRLE